MPESPIPFRSSPRSGAREDLTAPPDRPGDDVRDGQMPNPRPRNVESMRPSDAATGATPRFASTSIFRVSQSEPLVRPRAHRYELAAHAPCSRTSTGALTGILPDTWPGAHGPTCSAGDSERPEARRSPLVDPDAKWAATNFSARRQVRSDTALPWCTTGRVETSNGGWASGTRSGPATCGDLPPCHRKDHQPRPYVAGWDQVHAQQLRRQHRLGRRGAPTSTGTSWCSGLLSKAPKAPDLSWSCSTGEWATSQGGWAHANLRRRLGRWELLEPHRSPLVISGGDPAAIPRQLQPQWPRHSAGQRPR